VILGWVIAAVNAVGAVGLLAALARISIHPRRPFQGLGQFLLTAIILLGLAEEAVNFMETRGYLPEADLFEGTISPLFPMLWVFLFVVELERADRDRLSRTLAQIRTVHNLALKVTVAMEPQAVMDEVVEAAGRLLGAPLVAILTPDEQRQSLIARAGRGVLTEEIRSWHFSMSDGIGGWAFLQRQPLRTDQPDRDMAAPARPTMARLGVTSIASVPLLFHNEAVGVLSVGRTRGETFSDEDVRLLETLCAHAAVAIHNARLYARVTESEAKYRVLVENAQLAIAAVDVNRHVVFWNRGAQHLFGWTAEEALGRHISLIYPPSKLDDVQSTILAGIDRDGAWSGEFPLVRKDGTPFTGFLGLARVYDPRGANLGTVGILADVTDQVQLREQLFQAQKMQTIGTLASGIAHDFNNLLTAIIGFSGLLRESLPKGSDQHDAAASIEVAAQRGTQLVRQLMAFSHKQPTAREPLDLNLVVDEVVSLLARTFPKVITVDTLLEADLRTVQADPVQMHQVLMNLAVNARDAMPEGGTLTFGTENVDLAGGETLAAGLPPGPYVALTVQDTGNGIPAEVQPRVFEPFFTTKAGAGGTGLGLSTVYAIVARHGGRITFKSQAGLGTSFRILLPAAGPSAA
jgi:PAS domain S-box-containing protein